MNQKQLSDDAQKLLDRMQNGEKVYSELYLAHNEYYQKHHAYYVRESGGVTAFADFVTYGGGEPKYIPYGDDATVVESIKDAFAELIDAGLVEYLGHRYHIGGNSFAVFVAKPEQEEVVEEIETLPVFVGMTTIGYNTGKIFLAEGATEQEAFNNSVEAILPTGMWRHADIYDVTKRRNLEVVTLAKARQYGYRQKVR